MWSIDFSNTGKGNSLEKAESVQHAAKATGYP